MAGLLASPYGNDVQQSEFVGTIVLACRIQRTGIGFASKITDKLPYPAVLTNIKIWGNTVATGLADTLVLVDLTEENFTRTSALPVQPGDFFGWYPPNASFDPLNETGVGFGVFNTTQSHDFDCWVPVPGSTWRLRVSLLQSTAITPRVEIVATFKKLRNIVIDPATAILPRGTLLDPVCVRICDDDRPKPPPPPPGGGGGGPPPPPPPPPTSSLNPAVVPLPPPSEIDPFDPMGPGALSCAVDRYDPEK